MSGARSSRGLVLPDQRFEAVVFDWDGTAVPDREADASAARALVEDLCRAGVHVVVVSGTHVGNVDGQLKARPAGPGRLHLCLNRGSEVFEVGETGPQVVARRQATDAENRALDAAAALAVERLGKRGVCARVVSQRLNRRKIDIIPEPEWDDPPKARIGELLDAVTARLHAAGMRGLDEAVDVALDAASEAGVRNACVTSDVKHVEIGLTDKSHSARWAARWLARRGITGGLVLIGGDEFGPLGNVRGSDSLMLVPELARAVALSVGVEPEGVPDGVRHVGGGPRCFLAILGDQVARRAQRRVPDIDRDPAWTLALPGDVVSERVAESLGALSNGSVGLRAAREEDGFGTTPGFVAAGVYTDGERSVLLPGPVWSSLAIDEHHEAGARHVDLRTGVLLRATDDGIRTLRFVSAAEPDVLGLRAEGPCDRLGEGNGTSPSADLHVEHEVVGGDEVAWTGGDGRGSDGISIAVAAHEHDDVIGGRRVVDRVATWATGSSAHARAAARERLQAASRKGFDEHLAAHRAEWAGRWASADVTIDGPVEDQLAARFAVFHLLSAAADTGEAAVGARGLTGDAYGGHVFWDADVFVLPALAALRPSAARAMLEYRIRRLAAARAAALAIGARGARFPWESAADGRDVTPRHVRGKDGRLIPIRTGQREEHIVADIAWAATQYAAWTGDDGFLAGRGRELVIDTARYWASRIRLDGAGRGHLYGVMGPDEYHEVVDDNAFTNVMARWNLRAASVLAGTLQRHRDETSTWRALAESLVESWHEETGLYEQFAGYFGLEPLLASAVGRPPFAADALIGAKRVAGSQLIKQADVMMLHHMVPDEVVPGSLHSCLRYYEPRTAHGSSLSPPIHAALLARDGQPERALELFRLAARLDLDDPTETTAHGLHLATMGGVWQALAHGFLGLRPRGPVLDVHPCLPAEWRALTVRLHFRGQPVTVRADHDTIHVSCTSPVLIRVGAHAPVMCMPPGRAFAIGRER